MTSSTGLTAMVALAVAAVSLIAVAVLAIRVRRLRADQSVLLGSGASGDLVSEAASTRRSVAELARRVEAESGRSSERFDAIEVELAASITGFSLVRYDAFDEASGRQSVSIALVDSSGSGVVLSSLVRRESARMYARQVGRDGDDADLSPEEVEAVKAACERSAGR